MIVILKLLCEGALSPFLISPFHFHLYGHHQDRFEREPLEDQQKKKKSMKMSNIEVQSSKPRTLASFHSHFLFYVSVNDLMATVGTSLLNWSPYFQSNNSKRSFSVPFNLPESLEKIWTHDL